LWNLERLKTRDKAPEKTLFMPPHQEVLEEVVGEIPGSLVYVSPINSHEAIQRGGSLDYRKPNLDLAFQHNLTSLIVTQNGIEEIQDNDIRPKFQFVGGTFASGLRQLLSTFGRFSHLFMHS